MKTTTSITIDDELLKKLDLVAKKERRTRSNMLEIMLIDFIPSTNKDINIDEKS